MTEPQRFNMTAQKTRPHVAFLMLLTLLLSALSGCDWANPYGTSVGDLQAVSLSATPITVHGDFNTAVYSKQLTSETSFYVCDLTIEQITEQSFDTGQVLRVELLWEPKPGKTPLDHSATNISMRYVIFANGEVGVYEGGGFALVNTIALTDRITLSILDSSLRLSDSTSGFHDLLGPTRITGTFTARLDPKTTHRMHVLLSQRVTDELGTSTLVRDDNNGSETLLVLRNINE